MDLIGFMVLLSLLSITMTCSTVEGSTLLSEEEELELEKRIQSLNKPSIKTIQDEAGDVFDCVNIMMQPAFDHPLLKNHKIKMGPTSNLRESRKEDEQSRGESMILLNDVGCPQGAVPIRRVQKEDLIRVRTLSQSYRSARPLTKENPGSHLAIFRSLNTSVLYTGVEGYFNLLNPRVKDQEWSSGQMWIENGPKDDYNMIQAGWTVSPQLYGDYSTRSFIYWKGKGNKDGCYNLLCPGFVQVDKDHPIGKVLPTSGYDEVPIEFPISIYQDQGTKDWWLVNVNNASIKYGYFPKELFPYMEGGAPQVAWGGVTVGSANEPNPPMGSGYFPDGYFRHAGFAVHIKVTDKYNNKIDPEPYLFETYADVPKCYDVKDYGPQKQSGYTIMYGGPGGDCGA